MGVRTKRAEAMMDAPRATGREAIESLLAVAVAAALRRIPMPEGILIEIVVILEAC